MPQPRPSGSRESPSSGPAASPGGGLGALLRARRLAAGLTQAELARRAGAGLGTVRDLEQGRTRSPAAGLAARLARALDLDPAAAAGFMAAARARAGAVPAGGEHRPGPAAPGGLWLRVLGPLEAWRAGELVGLGAPKHRVVLGMLAMTADLPVRRDALVDAVWGEAPPATARHLVQSYVSCLRGVLDPGRSPRDPAGLLVSAGTSYRLRASAAQLDLLAFGDLADRARAARAAGEPASACALYEQALALWRGQPLDDLDELRSHPAVVAVRQRRMAAVCGYADAADEAGTPERALPQLREAAGREPLDEQLHGRLMIALAAAGQQAAALREFAGLRGRLDHELGVRPGPYLALVHTRLLREDMPVTAGSRPARLSHPGQPGTGRGGGPAIPRQLPGAVPHFTGREAELAALTGLLGSAGAMVISAIGGTAGVGKTALAVHWAHQVAGQFPDGQLYVNLRGYDPDQPAAPADALAGFLRALGVSSQDIPAEPGERAARYRSLMAGRRMLVLLDNASTAEQVRPLLPGGPACVVLVTSRDALAGLVARDGARRVDLGLLPIGDAVSLLRALIGGRVADDPQAASALAVQCSRLPLALRVAAELAVARPAMPLTDLAGELAGQHRRLDLLETGEDDRSAVRAVFSWSCRHLQPGAARAFRLLGLHPGPDFDHYALAALTGGSQDAARRLAGQLARAHLIYASGPHRYGMHDLLRDYARELAAADEGAAARRAALTRLFDYYQAAAAAAAGAYLPSQPIPSPGQAAAPIPPLAGPTAARAWLDAERATLVTATEHAATHGWPGHAIRLAATLFGYLDVDGHCSDARSVHTQALHAASRTGDQAAQAHALVSLAGVDWRQGQDRQAARLLEQALGIFRAAGDRSGQARTLRNMGILLCRPGRYPRADDYFRRALALSRQAGDRISEARTLDLLGVLAVQQGRHEDAASCHRQALATFREMGDLSRAASVLDNLGAALCRQGRYRQADSCLREALALFRGLGGRIGEASVLDNLGALSRCQGQYQQAAAYHQQTLAIYRQIGDKAGQTRALNGLGEVFLATGQAEHGRVQHAAALSLGSQLGDNYQQARAHTGLARACAAAGDPALARHHRQRALSIYARLGVPEARELSAQPATP